MYLSFVLCIHYFAFDVVCVNSNSKWNRKVSLKIQYGYHPVSHSEAKKNILSPMYLAFLLLKNMKICQKVFILFLSYCADQKSFEPFFLYFGEV